MRSLLHSALVLCLASILLAGVLACRGPQNYEVQKSIQEMLAGKFAALKAVTKGLPDGAGIFVYLETPNGRYRAGAGLPAGADENWHYRIASVSKTFTAAGIMLLDQQGKLKIDDVVTAKIPGVPAPYLPDSPNYAIPYKDQITIRQLLSHRAGVFDIWNEFVPTTSKYPYAGKPYNSYVTNDMNEPDHQFTTDELLAVISANKLYTKPPGTEFSYTDTGYNLLAKIIERVSGKSYDRFLADNFFVPLGLTETFAPWSAYDTKLPEPFFRGYVGAGSTYFEIPADNMSSQIGPGNIVSTPADMARWMRTLLSGKGPLTKAQLARMTAVAPGNTDYGLGIMQNVLGMGHSGGHPGYTNVVGYNPDDDVVTVAVMLFVDYNDPVAAAVMRNDAAKQAKVIAGYPGVPPPAR